MIVRGLVALGIALAVGDGGAPGPTDGGAAGPAAPPGRVCVPPLRRAYMPCFKATSLSEDEVRACEARHAADRHVQRFRLGQQPWVEYSPRAWRCVAAPLGRRTRAYIEHVVDDWVTPTAACPRVDLGLNGYGALSTRCSRRDASRDELVTPQ